MDEKTSTMPITHPHPSDSSYNCDTEKSICLGEEGAIFKKIILSHQLYVQNSFSIE